MIAMALSIIGYVLMINATWTCNYFLIDGYLTYNGTYFVSDPSQQKGVGLFSFQGLDPEYNQYWYCYQYSQSQLQNSGFLDGPFKAGLAMGILANICLGITMVAMLAIGCVSFAMSAIKVIGILCMFGSLFAILTFVTFGSALRDSPYNATFFIAPGVAIAASVVAFITGVIVLMLPPAKPADPYESEPTPQPYEPGTETVTETTMPDGTKKITKTKVNPDGSQTVEETVIKPTTAAATTTATPNE